MRGRSVSSLVWGGRSGGAVVCLRCAEIFGRRLGQTIQICRFLGLSSLSRSGDASTFDAGANSYRQL